MQVSREKLSPLPHRNSLSPPCQVPGAAGGLLSQLSIPLLWRAWHLGGTQRRFPDWMAAVALGWEDLARFRVWGS